MAQPAKQFNNELDIDLIRIDGGTQPRAEIKPDTVAEYAEAITNGAKFPPVVVFYDGKDYWLADGFHRRAAHVELGLAEIEADVRQGTRRDAVLYSVGANADHGLRRTNEDKRRAVLTLLNDAEWQKWSDREIARKCGVSDFMVRSLRENRSDTRTYTDRHGNVSVMDTSRIGQRQEPYIPRGIDVAAEIARRQEMQQSSLDAATAVALVPPANDNTPAAYRTSFTGNNEWYTPARYVELARTVLGQIDMDPASNDFAQRTVKAAAYFTEETNGLDKPWQGNIWMNPPYSRNLIGRFIDKIIDEYRSGRVAQAIVLTNNTTDTAWFGKLFRSADAMCFTTGRVKFVSPSRKFPAPPQGQTFTYFGPRRDQFASVFSSIGNVVASLQPASALQLAA